MQLESVVLLEYLLCSNDNLWLLKRLFHSPSASPRYTFFGNGLVTSHLYTMLLTRQFPFNGHSDFLLQLQFGLWSRGFDVTFLLCHLIIFGILFMQL